MTLAILCSGQGGQHRDMFALTSDAPEAAQLFTHATALLGGRDPREFVRGEADGVLQHNRAGQILCTLQPLAAACALADVIPRGVVIAGYSVGEVAAWGVGGLFDATATLDLVARRAEAMDAATHAGDGLIFVRGLSRDEIGRLCERHGAAIAIVNPGFSVDCIETLDEIGREVAETFHHAGGKNFAHIPCLNDSAEGMAVIEAMVRRELSGWA